MSRSHGLSLLVRIGAACQRSCSSGLAGAAAATSGLSCLLGSQASTPTASWRPWSLGHNFAPGQTSAVLDSQAFRSFASKRDDAGSSPRPRPPNYFVGLGNLRDNPGATRQRIRAARGNAGRRNKYAGRGMKGQKSRGGPHILFDGGQKGLLKFPVMRQRPPYEVLYYQLGLSRVVEYVQLGLLDPTRTITMKDLYDTGCVTSNIKYGVLLYGKARLSFPLDIQVTACDLDTRGCVEAAGGRITRVYYTMEGLSAILHPEKYISRRLPLPLPAAGWHPKFNTKFDAVGQVPPAVRENVLALAPAPAAPPLAAVVATAATKA